MGQPATFPMAAYVKLGKKDRKRPAENRGAGTDWSRLIFSTAPDYIGEERAGANKTVRSFIKRAANEEATEIKPEFRREAIDLLANVLHLDPNIGSNILKVWPYHVDRPISTDPADYLPLLPADRPYTLHPETQADITPNS